MSTPLKRIVILVGVLAALSAGAYVLPGGAIMRRMVAGREELQLFTLKADGSLHFYGPGGEGGRGGAGPAGGPSRAGGGRLGVPEAAGPLPLRGDGASEGNTVASVSSGGRKRLEGTEIPALTEAVQQVCALLAMRADSAVEGREVVEAHLRSLGIEPRTTSLGRFDGEVVYVLGTPGEGKPQFWVYKEGFRPARLRYKDGTGHGVGRALPGLHLAGHGRDAAAHPRGVARGRAGDALHRALRRHAGEARRHALLR